MFCCKLISLKYIERAAWLMYLDNLVVVKVYEVHEVKEVLKVMMDRLVKRVLVDYLVSQVSWISHYGYQKRY